MIVKNESSIIERLLSSIEGIIDSYCICDTGSTDNTREKIETFMKARGIPGEVFSEPFKNFGYNRNLALQRANKWADYVLLLDADMKLVIGPDFNKDFLTKDGYTCIQGNPSFEYYNTRIIRTNRGVTCICPTHEYYGFPSGLDHSTKLSKSFMYIADIGDGGAKADKYERDIRLLKQGLEDEPNNARYHFYIANSYRDIGQYKEAIDWYNKRIKLGGWDEEIWNSYLEMGKCYMRDGDKINGINTLLLAYNYRPSRAESLYEIIKYYREEGKHQIAALFYEKAKNIPYPTNDVLFIYKAVYDFLLDFECSILSYYTGTPIDHKKYLNLINIGYALNTVISNYQYYVQSLNKIQNGALIKKRIDFTEKCEKMIRGKLDTFKSSSPCIIPYSEGYLLNIRYVNYNLLHNGAYTYTHDDCRIITLNRCLLLDRSFNIRKEFWMDKVHREDTRYLGVEDIKIFSHDGELRFLGTTQDELGRPRVGEGIYNYKSKSVTPIVYESPCNASCEKNWVYFHHKGELKVIYKWSPIQYGTLQDSKFIPEGNINNIPNFFSQLRGSTNGCTVSSSTGDEIWFLCHYVEYSTPRQYYHCIVILDAETLSLKRHSILFKFEGEKIEYALGLVVESDRIIISYSKWDAESIVTVYNRKLLEEAIF
jgi:tetratricopeptide (TPR) repeat protein